MTSRKGDNAMNMQFSLAHLTALDYAPPELTYLAARAGYDFVSLRPIYMGLPGEKNYELAANKKMLRDTKTALKETGLGLLDIELARIDKGIDPKNFEPAFEVAAELGGRHVLSSVWTDDSDYALNNFVKVCELADTYGLTVELEFVPIASITTLAGAVDMLEKAKQPNSGLMIDAHHFYRSGDTLEALSRVPKEWFRYMHLCDAPGHEPASEEEMTRILREERLYVGEGSIDLAGMINVLPDMPYSLEIPHTKRAQELGHEEFARRCLESAKSFVKQHAAHSI